MHRETVLATAAGLWFASSLFVASVLVIGGYVGHGLGLHGHPPLASLVSVDRDWSHEHPSPVQAGGHSSHAARLGLPCQ